MLDNIDLHHLNSLVSREIASGKSGAEALAALASELSGRVIQAKEFAFDRGHADQELPEHLLLCDTAPLTRSTADLYAGLSGTGKGYDGMFGNGEMLRNQPAADSLHRGSSSPASIPVQVTLCLRILGGPQVSMEPALVDAVRLRLSSILLEYPVLMHPAILVPVRNSGNIEFTTIASALATTPHGGLPRPGHFPIPLGLDSQALMRSLTEFAVNPCVIAAMSEPMIRVRDQAAGKGGIRSDPKVSREVLARSLLRAIGPRVEFLGSVMELDDLRAKASGDSKPTPPFWCAMQGAPQLRPQLLGMMAQSTAAASGLVHTSSTAGHMPDSMFRHRYDASFLACVRARMGELRPLDISVDSFVSTMASGMQRRIFLGRGDEVSPGEIAHNTEALIRGLVESGTFASTEAAAIFSIQHCIGPGRPDDVLPRTDTTGAIAFLKTIDALGGLGDGSDEAALRSLALIRHEVATIPAHPTPFRDAWTTACDVTISERSMFAVINRIIPSKLATNAEDRQMALDLGGSGPANGASSSPPRRRSRATL
ncbi:hypothetical protein [Paucibacter soli]|uniref:hypothetical protein n=1 Tax=Paucibacter soli TaxID=3133433 RepID=UPI0030ABB137